MHRLLFSTLVFLLACVFTAQAAAPMTPKDVAMLIRLGSTEAEILAELGSRKLIAPLDSAAEDLLRTSGATDALMAKLKSGAYALSANESAQAARASAERRAAVERQQALDAAAFAERQRNLAKIGATAVASDKLRSMLDGNLVRLRGDSLVPFDAGELKYTRIVLLYQSAHWCGPCRRFTPKLVDFYRRMKPNHPELEIIFLSSDRSEANMREYMRSTGMQWPAVKFGKDDPISQQYCGAGIPWLVAVNDAGQPLTQNGIDKKYVAPEAVLAAIEKKLSETK